VELGDFKYGLVWMDAQHSKFIEWFNKLYAACEEGKCALEIIQISKFIECYILDHFLIEESYMNKYNYPNFEQHKREHLKFTSDYKKFTETSLKKGNVVGDELLEIMADYIMKNITHEDQKLAKFLRRKGVK